MNKRNARWVTIEDVATASEPRTRVTCLVDPAGALIQVRMGRGKGHQTVTMSVTAWRYLCAEVAERIADTGRGRF